MRLLVLRRDVSVRDTFGRHLLSDSGIRARSNDDTKSYGSPPHRSWKNPGKAEAGSDSKDGCSKSSFSSRFHVLPSRVVSQERST